MEAKQTFEAGQIVFSEIGEQAEYVAKASDGHIVRPIVEVDGDYDYGPHEHVCDPTMWRNVFNKPPVAKFSTELKDLHEQIAAARKTMEAEDAEYRRTCVARQEKFKRHALLDVLEAFLDKKITHYVEIEYYGPPKIIDVKEAVASESGNWEKKLRLLTLGGELRSGEIRWEINRYSDGSGNANTVMPCTSYEQAVEHVKVAISKHLAGTSSNNEARPDFMDAADKYGVTVPEAYRRRVAEARIRQIENNIEHNRRQAKVYAELVAQADADIAALRTYLL